MTGCSSNAESAEAASLLERAASALRRGAAVVYPTETSYGLGVDATDTAALEHLRRLKVRTEGKPISVLISDHAMLSSLVRELPPGAHCLMEKFWPGPLTLVLPARSTVSDLLTAGTGTIGVRWSSHAVATALVEAFGGPVTTPSANPAGAPPATSVDMAQAYFGDEVDVYLDGGRLPAGSGSTVVDLAPEPRILRQGSIAAPAIFAVLGEEG